MREKAALIACASAVAAVAGCGESSPSKSKQVSKNVLTEWVSSAVDQDGPKYCDALTKNLIEKLTAATGDKAKKKCEQLVKQGDPKLPLRVTIKSGKATKTTAQATLAVSAPNGPISLRKEDGAFKIDQAQSSASASKPPKPKPPAKTRKQRRKSR